VPRSGVIYILGCFAQHLTLFSQQVRALNLIYGLFKSGKLVRGANVAVIGGGAAGLTAGAAAAYRGARVTLLDRQQGPMALQQNNRQRWLHPHNYDWPYPDERSLERFESGEAQLPLLTWKSDYAANVARQITAQWEFIRRAYSIQTWWCVRRIKIFPGTSLKWSMRNQSLDPVKPKQFSAVILAVGFGLEPKKYGQDSYWAEDDIDGTFRPENNRVPKLVSGCGDGAFIDLMRVCIHRFRHDEILNLIAGAQGIESLKADLRALQLIRASRGIDHQAAVSGRFASLSIDNELENVIRAQLRTNNSKVYLVTKNQHIYGPRTSILNRLVVQILHETRAFEHVIGETKKVRRKGKQFDVGVKLPTQKRLKHYTVQKAVLRHGVKSTLAEDFEPIYKRCIKMELRVKSLPAHEDRTRVPNWSNHFFSQKGRLLSSRTGNAVAVPGNQAALGPYGPNFADTMDRFGVWSENLEVRKQLRSDGSSTITYTVNGLSVKRGKIRGVGFHYESAAGRVDRVKVSSLTKRWRVRWIKKPVAKQRDPFDNARNEARFLSGTVQFSEPLMPLNGPLSFRLSFRLVNSDALTGWEFQQMYEPKKQRHLDERPLEPATEYLGWVVWFPTRELQIRVTLPTRIDSAVPSMFRVPKRISRSDVIRKSVLEYPSRKCDGAMIAVAKPVLPPYEPRFFAKSQAQTWALSVCEPKIGSCYSIDWPLPKSGDSKSTVQLQRRAKAFRDLLLRYRNIRRSGREFGLGMKRTKVQSIASSFRDFYNSLRLPDDCASDRFVVSLMTYDEQQRRLVVVDGARNGQNLDPKSWDFWLPFGLGLAGSCFKANRIFQINSTMANDQLTLADKDRPDDDSGFYLRIPGRPHKFLLQVPIDHPRFRSALCPADFESSKQSIGVVSISSRNGKTALARLQKYQEFANLQKWCQGFCNSLYQVLMEKP